LLRVGKLRDRFALFKGFLRLGKDAASFPQLRDVGGGQAIE
jgi:hypothetical protein